MLRIIGTICIGEPGRERLVHRRRRVHPRRLVLREILHDDVVAERRARRCRAAPRRTASASASTCRRRWGRRARCDRRARCAGSRSLKTVRSPYALRACFSSITIRPLFAHGGKLKLIFLRSGGTSSAHHLLELLDPALHLRRFRRLVAEAVDEHLDARDLLVLLALRLAHRLDALVVLGEVAAVVGVVVGQRPQRQVGDPRHHRVEEEAIVRHEDDRVRIRVQILLEPVARLEIEMVGRLVEQQQVRLAEQQLGRARSASASRRRTSRSAARSPAVLKPRPWSTVAVFSSML